MAISKLYHLPFDGGFFVTDKTRETRVNIAVWKLIATTYLGIKIDDFAYLMIIKVILFSFSQKPSSKVWL